MSLETISRERFGILNLMFNWTIKLASIVILVLAAVFAYGKFGPGLPISSVVTQKTDFFTVSGEGKVTVVPDTAMVNLGINSSGNSVKVAQANANGVINKISDALKKLGIADKDIKTNNYSIYPQTDQNKVVSYSVSINLTVTVRQLDKINDVLDSATANGANMVGGVQLTVDETKQKELTQRARELAVRDAKQKADSLSRAAGLSLGRIVNVVEGGVVNPRPMPMMATGIAKLDTGTQIQPGSTDITSSVTLFYETR